MMTVVYIVVGAIVGLVAALAIKKVQENNKKRRARDEADRILNNAKAEAQKLERKAKELEQNIKRNAEKDIQKLKENLTRQEKSLKDKESRLESQFSEKAKILEDKERILKDEVEKLNVVERRLEETEKVMKEKIDDLAGKLQHVSGMTKEEAKREIVEAVRSEAQQEGAKKAIAIEAEAKEEAEDKAKKIISLAMARYAGEYAAQKTTSVIELPSEEMKGRIIGREGRNIRALEAACGVDLIVDDTPELVVISAFDPVRREVARRSLETLMEDGRVHPGRIEEVVEKVKNGIFKSIKDEGDKACLDLGITGVDTEIIKLIGSLRYRTSYTQNNYEHSMEVAYLCGIMAAEVGLDPKVARRAGLLHDIGKALDHSIEGSHAVIGAEFAKRHGEHERICHAIRAHHEDEKPKTALAHIVAAADALSSARPGARKQMSENYVQRLEDLESIGNSFDGVLRTFAIQAGREVRVLVEGSKVTDDQAVMLSRDIARKIEREMNFPGQIKVTVVRETRAVEHAR
jgi:ribonuclease Y